MSRQPITDIDPVCIECHALAVLVTGEAIYPNRPDLWGKGFYRCTCGAYVGTHDGTDIPLGYPAGPETRAARHAAHEAFDPIWKAKKQREGISNSKARGAGYKWLADQLGIRPQDAHISHFDAATAQRVVEICKPYYRQRGPR